MPLIDLKTTLKSLKFGKDRPYEGSSNQPYIQSSIPEGDIPTSGGPDFILRGGILAPISAAKDVSRLTQMFFDLKSPNGFQFIAKQNLLSRTSVQTEASTGAGYGGNFVNQGVYLPSSTLAQAGVGFTGTHLNLFGIDPSSPMAGITQTSLSSLFFNKSDSESILTLGLNRYGDIVKEANNKDFNPPKDKKDFQKEGFRLSPTDVGPNLSIISSKDQPSKYSNRLLKFWDKKQVVENIDPNIRTYPGGPGSILGVGDTYIKFADQRTGVNNPKLDKDFFTKGYSIFKRQTTVRLSNPDQNSISSNINYINAVPSGSAKGASSTYESVTKEPVKNNIDYTSGQRTDFIDNVYQSGNFKPTEQSTENGSLTFTQDQLIKQNQKGEIQDFRRVLIDGIPNGNSGEGVAVKDIRAEKSSIISLSPDYFSQNIENRVNLGNPGSPKNVYSYTAASKSDTAENYKLALDKITAGNIYTASVATHGKYLSPDNTEHAGNDLAKFSIGVIQNKVELGKDKKPIIQSNYMHFRAFIDSFSDSYTSDWNSYNYVGRGDKFYNYTGFERTINLSFTVFAQSKAELIPMYRKLNYLASSLTPDYSTSGFMKGNLHKMTIGGYLFEQVGIIKSLTYDVPEETPWEIGINDVGGFDDNVKELPHMIKVTNLSFVPIQDFLPRVADPKNQKNTRYIALSKTVGNTNSNYEPV
jgi:hypothetical protein